MRNPLDLHDLESGGSGHFGEGLSESGIKPMGLEHPAYRRIHARVGCVCPFRRAAGRGKIRFFDDCQASGLERFSDPSQNPLRVHVVDEDVPAVNEIEGISLYNLACAYALTGHTEEAIEALAASWKAGFDLLEPMQSDSDLDSIQGEAAFKKLIRMIERDGDS